jgi:hypothetical protein
MSRDTDDDVENEYLDLVDPSPGHRVATQKQRHLGQDGRRCAAFD